MPADREESSARIEEALYEEEEEETKDPEDIPLDEEFQRQLFGGNKAKRTQPFEEGEQLTPRQKQHSDRRERNELLQSSVEDFLKATKSVYSDLSKLS